LKSFTSKVTTQGIESYTQEVLPKLENFMQKIQKNYDDLKAIQNRVRVFFGDEFIKIVNFSKKLLQLSE